MKLLYVDYENVGSLGLDGIGMLSSSYNVYILYGSHHDTIKFEVVEQICQTKAKKIFCFRG